MIYSILFWAILIVLFYTYAGYGLILSVLVFIKNQSQKKKYYDPHFEPEVCLFVTAYNESVFVDQKVKNSFSLDYPSHKVQHIWITDGSDDGTPDLLRKYQGIEVYHLPERRGKIHAMNRGISFVKAPFIIFSDTNTLLSKNTIREMVLRFSDEKVGCIAGEKRIVENTSDNASGAGEGLYWKLESRIKRLDAALSSAVGGVGELFAIRTGLFEPVEEDTILDDFTISLRIASKGYRIDYTPDAFAEETASLNIKEELKRKIRIAAGGVQTLIRMKSLLNPFKFGILSWQYFSHKVLRWTVAPVLLFLFFPVNLALVASQNLWLSVTFPSLVMFAQICFYLLALAGWYFENHKTRIKLFFAPYYFVAIHYASIRGMVRYFRGKQQVTWEKSRRA